MDDVDDERFSLQGPFSMPVAGHARRSAAVPEVTGRRQVEGSREEQLLGSASSPHAVRVRGLDEQERVRIQREMQLLATLEVAGVTAAPAVLELEDDGYVREAAAALSRRSGRRAAGTGAPPAGERRALAHAREALDALIGALHERSWVLGAPYGRGLGARADGSVVVLDLHGLRHDDSLSARHDDRRWVDSVLQDQDRTLRRRIHVERPRTDGDALLLDSAPAPEEPPAPPRHGLPIPRGRRRRAAAGPLPRAHPSEGPAQGRGTSHVRTGAAGAVLSSILEVLRHPRLRRTAVLSGALVMMCGALAGLGAWWVQGRGAPSPDPDHPVAAAPTQDAPRPAPSIDEPQMLVAELAGSRHSYVTGLSDLPASSPGSAALDEDERLRVAYEGVTVHAGGPVVHSAEVVEQPGSEGTAVLHAVTSMEEVHLEGADGSTTMVPATDPSTIRLVLHWDGEQWRIVSADRLPEAAGAGAP
ncbi:MAG: hypothetical protein L0H74_10010 [Brachybacterium sp.]|nr:hypothetical protein [Brachybacterium sp.]